MARRLAVLALTALALSALVPSLAADGRAEEYDPMLAEMGAEAFVRYCASCHGRDARGQGPVAPALTRRPADLTTIAARRDGGFPAGEIARKIDGRFEIASHGSREMPVWGGRFTAAVPEPGLAEEMARGQIAVLVEYLKSIQVE